MHYYFFFLILVSWPRGRYSLPRPKPEDGCPPGWQKGCRYQDNEDTHNINSVTPNPGHHFYGKHNPLVAKWSNKHYVAEIKTEGFETFVKEKYKIKKKANSFRLSIALFWSKLTEQWIWKYKMERNIQNTKSK